MSFRDTDAIDIVVDAPDRENGVDLLIVESPGDSNDEAERYQLLVGKLQTYVSYVLSQDFLESFPNTNPSDVAIRVYCATPPNDQMVEIVDIELDAKNRIAVFYQDMDEIPE